jgi:hypothetical protein
VTHDGGRKRLSWAGASGKETSASVLAGFSEAPVNGVVGRDGVPQCELGNESLGNEVVVASARHQLCSMTGKRAAKNVDQKTNASSLLTQVLCLWPSLCSWNSLRQCQP